MRPLLSPAGLFALALLGPAPLHAQAAPPARSTPIEQSALIDRLTQLTDSLAATGHFSGVVALQRNGAVVLARAYGDADRSAHRPNTVETAFNIGSINKLFTTIAIRQLASAGKLALDSTLASVWPDYPNAAVAQRVTIRQLLRHQSGIMGNIFAAPASGRRSDIRRVADYLPLFVNEPLAFEPGSENRYSNAGYIVLGLLVERLSGEDYYTYVSRHIYEPAGLTGTAHYAVDSLPPQAAIGYTRDDAEGNATAAEHANSQRLPGRGSSAGGGYSTAGDLLRLVQALRERRVPDGPPAGIGVAGGTVGVNAIVEGDLPGGYDLVVLQNLDPPAAERVARAVRGWLGVRDD